MEDMASASIIIVLGTALGFVVAVFLLVQRRITDEEEREKWLMRDNEDSASTPGRSEAG